MKSTEMIASQLNLFENASVLAGSIGSSLYMESTNDSERFVADSYPPETGRKCFESVADVYHQNVPSTEIWNFQHVHMRTDLAGNSLFRVMMSQPTKYQPIPRAFAAANFKIRQDEDLMLMLNSRPTTHGASSILLSLR